MCGAGFAEIRQHRQAEIWLEQTTAWRRHNMLDDKRGVAFEEVVSAMAHGGLLDVLEHPNASRYSNQRIFVVRVEGYAYLVAFVESEKEVFLKTVIPSRKATRRAFPIKR